MSRDCGDVACVRPELLPGRCGGGPRQGTRGCRGVSRDCGDVACVSPDLFLKGARHRRRLCPVGPHIQQRLLIAPPSIVGYV